LDINGAKALKKRLSLSGRSEASPAPGDVDISEDAPPVYHWLGVPKVTPDSRDDEDDGAAPRTSLFRRLGFSFR
jgi:hypothetical protein